MASRIIADRVAGLAFCLALFGGPCATLAKEGRSQTNPLVGVWILDRAVDTPAGGKPVYYYGERPIGLFTFTSDGHVSINIQKNPRGSGPISDESVPSWYLSYFGTYTYDPSAPSWTTHVQGGNVPGYLGTDQTRRFRIDRDVMTITVDYMEKGKAFRAERVLHKARP